MALNEICELSPGRPMTSLFVFSQDISGCSSAPVDGAVSDDSSLWYLCSVQSREDGTFSFPCLPSGEYTVVRFVPRNPAVEFFYFVWLKKKKKSTEVHLSLSEITGSILQRRKDYLWCRSIPTGFQSGAQQYEARGKAINCFSFR